ncbi:Fur-regulated basic protein FbpA [Jutongia huaianensis]|uniref:Fur-regulated basic protein FbpA n=1 Tax=Jutongia huaianensis TaxID=2763668 RepID=A0ABR7N081_9FIRM|nr:Fur-regulated basic protein FbpA [Jutongia huaianensis]RHU97283.1 Fur-regulated basic protein FbpA [Clostridium sp. OM07-9AC]RHV07448.1 Fur-regulated basic protein FbpA [Clostridium sp. OM07-10AC]
MYIEKLIRNGIYSIDRRNVHGFSQNR